MISATTTRPDRQEAGRRLVACLAKPRQLAPQQGFDGEHVHSDLSQQDPTRLRQRQRPVGCQRLFEAAERMNLQRIDGSRQRCVFAPRSQLSRVYPRGPEPRERQRRPPQQGAQIHRAGADHRQQRESASRARSPAEHGEERASSLLHEPTTQRGRGPASSATTTPREQATPPRHRFRYSGAACRRRSRTQGRQPRQ